jgi:hypothetical protein
MKSNETWTDKEIIKHLLRSLAIMAIADRSGFVWKRIRQLGPRIEINMGPTRERWSRRRVSRLRQDGRVEVTSWHVCDTETAMSITCAGYAVCGYVEKTHWEYDMENPRAQAQHKPACIERDTCEWEICRQIASAFGMVISHGITSQPQTPKKGLTIEIQ